MCWRIFYDFIESYGLSSSYFLILAIAVLCNQQYLFLLTDDPFLVSPQIPPPQVGDTYTHAHTKSHLGEFLDFGKTTLLIK